MNTLRSCSKEVTVDIGSGRRETMPSLANEIKVMTMLMSNRTGVKEEEDRCGSD